MESNDSDWDNDRFESLRASEDEIRLSYHDTVSLIIYEFNFSKEITNLENLILDIKEYILKNYKFEQSDTSSLKDGFIEVTHKDNNINCYYARQSPVKLTYAFDHQKMHTDRYKLITPQNSIKVKIVFQKDKITLLLFGAHEGIMKICLHQINFALNSTIGEYFISEAASIPQEDMKNILESLKSVSYIWIGPGESERFINYVEKHVGNEIKKIPEYLVHNKMYGIKLKKSPFVMDTIKEQGIKLMELQGRISLYGSSITVRISSSGKLIFWIPKYVVPIDKTSYEMAEIYYNRILTDTLKLVKQKTLREWFK